jgi:SAM-dependent methyltransferase
LGTYVQYGCGLSAPPGWLNYDFSPTLRLQRLPLIGPFFKRGPTVFPKEVRFGDIVAGLPLPDGVADGVYASHVLEHLALEDFWKALRNTNRLLKPGGIFRLVVPDLEIRARTYLEKIDNGIDDSNSWFMAASNLGARRRERGAAGFVRSAFGNSAHLWMWDERSMQSALEKSGFIDVRRCRFNDSGDKSFLLVEDRGRFRDAQSGIDECAMEAWKPL